MPSLKLLVLILLTTSSLAAEMNPGEKLERQFWDSLKNKNWDQLDKLMAPYIQLAEFDKVLNKEQAINLSKTAGIGKYDMSNIKVTDGPNTYVVSYNVDTSEKINGTETSSNAFRLSVWQKNNNDWQMTAHAILIPVTPPAYMKK